MRLTDRQWTLTGWWLPVACAVFVAVSHGAAAQADSMKAIPEIEFLDNYPGCGGVQALAARFLVRDVPVAIGYLGNDHHGDGKRVLVRRGGQPRFEVIHVPSTSEVAGRPRYPDRAQLDADLVLCFSPAGITLSNAEWTITSSARGMTLESTQESVSGDLTLVTYEYTEKQAHAFFRLNDFDAELVGRAIGPMRKVKIKVYFGFMIEKPESTQ